MREGKRGVKRLLRAIYTMDESNYPILAEVLRYDLRQMAEDVADIETVDIISIKEKERYENEENC